ncbi:hypothetical protein cypCar_00046273 [Cyprinus carpio]|nr:hypothetical protein cypCar_00046273 [Cyprinus carpio]
MDVVNAVKMIVLVWTFASVCEASDESGDKPTNTDTVKKGEAKLTTSEVTVIVFAIIVFIIIMLIIYRKYNPTIPCRHQRDYKTADSATKDDDNGE